VETEEMMEATEEMMVETGEMMEATEEETMAETEVETTARAEVVVNVADPEKEIIDEDATKFDFTNHELLLYFCVISTN
jgi:hypothetical protein